MTDRVPMLNTYMSEYGEFNIPSDIFNKSCVVKETRFWPHIEVIEGVESRHLWNWLHDQEVSAGKGAGEITHV